MGVSRLKKTYFHCHFSPFSPLETISTSLWTITTIFQYCYVIQRRKMITTSTMKENSHVYNSKYLTLSQKIRHFKPGVHTNDFAPIHRLRALKLGHASLATVFRPGRLTLQPILRENLESPVLRYQPITTAVVTDACLNTRWHHTHQLS